MKRLLVFAVALLSLVGVRAAVPSFDSFNTNDFSVAKVTAPWLISSKRSGVTNVYNNSFITYSNSVVTITNSTLVITNSSVVFNGDTNAIERLWTNSANTYYPTELQVQMNVTNLVSDNNLTASGGLITSPSPEALALGVNCISVAYRTYIKFASTSTNPASTTLELPTGEPGKQLVLQNRQAAGNTFTLYDNTSVCDAGGGHVRLASDWAPATDGETLDLICDGTDWIERGRYNPNVPGGPQLWQQYTSGGVSYLQPVSALDWPTSQHAWIAGTNTQSIWGPDESDIFSGFHDASNGDGSVVNISGGSVTNGTVNNGAWFWGRFSINTDGNRPAQWFLNSRNNGTNYSWTFVASQTNSALSLGSPGGVLFRVDPSVGDGGLPYDLNTEHAITTGNAFRLRNNGTVIDAVAAVSGWAGGGTKVKYDDGTYKTPSSGTTINPTDLYFPYRTSSTTFGDSPLYVESTNSVVMTNSAASVFFRIQNTSGSATLGVTTGGHAIVLGGVGETVFLGANNNGSGTVGCDATGFAPTASSTVNLGSASGSWKALYLSGMTKAQKALLTPTDGMIVYQTDNTPGFRGYVNGAWVIFSTAADP